MDSARRRSPSASATADSRPGAGPTTANRTGGGDSQPFIGGEGVPPGPDRCYVLEEALGAELLTAVRMAAAGGTYLNPQLGARIAAEREQLFLSPRTVETHRAHIQRKLNLTTRADLVGYALERGLLET